MTHLGSVPARQRTAELPNYDVPTFEGDRRAPATKIGSIVYLRLIWGHRLVLTVVGLVALVASASTAFLIPKRFESTARLMPPDDGKSSGLAMAASALSGNLGGLSGIAGDMLGLKSTSDVFVGILSSRTAQDGLIKQFDLKKLYGDVRMEDVRRDLGAHTNISVDRKSQIISITVTDRDPNRAAAMGQAYIEQLDRLVADLSTSSARRERLFLEGRLKAVSKDLESAETEFSQFSSKNSTIDITEQAKAMVEAATTLQGQLIAAESELEGLKQIYTDGNIRVRSVQARIIELKRQLRKIGGKGEDTNASSDDALYPSIRKLPLLGVAYADLYRRTKVQEAVFETLTKEYELAKVQEAKEIPSVRVLDSPNVPDRKSFPPRLVIMLLGTAFAITFAIALVVVKDHWDRIESTDPRKIFAQEVVTSLKEKLPEYLQNGSKDPAMKAEVSGPDFPKF